MHVFGRLQENNLIEHLGWSHYLGKQKNVVLHEPAPFEKSLEILKQSKICLNSNPFFKNGSHERIFNSLACGALPFTATLPKGRTSSSTSTPTSPPFNGQVNEILSNKGKRRAMAASGRAKVMKNHTWDKRVEELSLNF